jgi:hypothetical protein
MPGLTEDSDKYVRFVVSWTTSLLSVTFYSPF